MIAPCVCCQQLQPKVKKGENFPHTLFLSQQCKNFFFFLFFFSFLSSVSPCYLSTSIVPQCKEEILTKKYDCSLSKDKREKPRVECFTLRARIWLYYFLASLHWVTVSRLVKSEPSDTQHLQEEWGLGMLRDMDNKCSVLKYVLHWAISKKKKKRKENRAT